MTEKKKKIPCHPKTCHIVDQHTSSTVTVNELLKCHLQTIATGISVLHCHQVISSFASINSQNSLQLATSAPTGVTQMRQRAMKNLFPVLLSLWNLHLKLLWASKNKTTQEHPYFWAIGCGLLSKTKSLSSFYEETSWVWPQTGKKRKKKKLKEK